jgi:(1->4)-alpha-D-glucan 1-alpha-D-glucosylmutase
MVDPDNRRPVDFPAEAARVVSARQAGAAELTADWRDGRIKARVIETGIRLRGERPSLMADGTLEEVALSGRHASMLRAFRRADGVDQLLVVVPVRPLGLMAADRLALSGVEARLEHDLRLRNRLDDRDEMADLGDLGHDLDRFPVLLATSW